MLSPPPALASEGDRGHEDVDHSQSTILFQNRCLPFVIKAFVSPKRPLCSPSPPPPPPHPTVPPLPPSSPPRVAANAGHRDWRCMKLAAPHAAMLLTLRGSSDRASTPPCRAGALRDTAETRATRVRIDEGDAAAVCGLQTAAAMAIDGFTYSCDMLMPVRRTQTCLLSNGQQVAWSAVQQSLSLSLSIVFSLSLSPFSLSSLSRARLGLLSRPSRSALSPPWLRLF